MVDFVYAAAAGLDSQDISAFAALAENLFQLFAMFWTDISKDGKMETCALVHFTGVLGIHPRELAYQTAYGFTPTLSAMAWIGRLILLEYALPLEAYSHLKIPWPSRTQYPDQVQRLRDQIHLKYMRKGCFSPLGYICERTHHARTIATREGPRTNISWSPDLQVLSIAGQEISMSGLRQAAHLAVARTEQRARKLMLGLWPNVDLSKIKDSLVTHRPGHSFLSEPENQLQMSFKLLSRRAFSKDGGFSLKGPGRRRAIQYLKDRDEFVKHMFGAIHIPSGMPARSEELRVIRWADTVAAPRNIFALQGRMVLVFSYNKATTVSNKSFYIVRFPCPIMSQVLFLHLTYIQPFSDFLARQLQVTLAMSTNPHLFTLHDTATGCFSSNACLKSLQLSTQGCGFQLTIKLYRHTAISVVKKHIPAIIASFDPNAPSEYAMFLKTLAFQTGHTIQTHSRSYALDNTYPAKLQSDIIDRYYQSSLLWHRFLLLGEGDPLLLQPEWEELGNQSSQAIGYSPDLHLVPQDDEPESIEIEVETGPRSRFKLQIIKKTRKESYRLLGSESR
ncbi:hypothetical protein DL98DRAFT_624055 [Cadophora sp. DSE1049]|nr:hypothetical protein DL98DRAFT_624055 [Cadophora sp. DSE1049]